MVGMDHFIDRHSSLETFWRSIILLGHNVASYKFALAKSLLLFAVSLINVGTVAHSAVFNLETATIADINAAFEAGALSSEKLIQMCLKRIEAYDQQGPRLNTIITLNPRSLEQARALDAERSRSGPRSPMHGVPIVVKDLIDTHDMPTTAGFLPMASSQPMRDAFVIDRLRQAGAIILAKVNLSDWFGQASSPSGASTVAGQVQNPYKLGYDAGGSSTGTAVAVAAYFAVSGLGTETGTSVRNPASQNNLFGLVPTQGLVSRGGVLCNSFTVDRVGPMARSVYDLAAVLSSMVGFDPEDLLSQESIGNIPARGYTPFVLKDGLKGARLGVLRDLFSNTAHDQEGLDLIEAAIAQIKGEGALVMDPITTNLDLFMSLRSVGISRFEKKSATQMYLDRLGPSRIFNNMGEMIEQYPDLVKPRLLSQNQVGALDQDRQYAAYLKARKVFRKLMVELMDRYALDALIYPFRTLPGWKISDKMTSSDWYERSGVNAYNPLSPITGLPALVVPAGFTQEGLPIALEFLGRPFSEPTLIQLAA